MKEMAVYLLCVLGGNPSPSKEDVVNAMSAAGLEADDEKLDKLLEEIEGKNINELLANGKEMLAKFGSGEGGSAPAGNTDAADGGSSDPTDEVKVEEPIEDIGGNLGLFGDDGDGGDY